MSDLDKRFFPFTRLGLSRNPFGTLSEADWLAITVPPPALEVALKSGFDHLQIIGEKGCGKTTALHWLVAHFQQQGETVAYERLPEGRKDYRTDTQPLDLFALDEAQRLGFFAKRRLLKLAKRMPLILGNHVDYRRDFAKRGMTLMTIELDNHLTQEQLTAILQRRLDYFSLDDPTNIRFAEDAVAWLYGRFCDDLRMMGFYLYEVFQSLDEVREIHADDVAKYSS